MLPNDSLQKKRFQPSEVTNEIYVVCEFYLISPRIKYALV